ncbi:MAG: glyoxylate/hydroxypyruvate reductase A [Herminiimonas sp.]|nr:glyoxylate/hydroxypyruvate reductase A [Herminiimonas sp.]
MSTAGKHENAASAPRILFYAVGANPAPWLADLQAALPDASLRVWEEGDDAPADYAIVWKPPAAMLAGRTDLKAVFNMGAGVDAILQLGDALPSSVPIVRLDDAGMGVQMAEYVTHAVLRYFRRFDQFEAQQRNGQWRFLKAFEKDKFAVGILGLGVLGSRIASGLAPFGFPLHGWSRTVKQLDGVTCHSGAAGLDAFLAASQVVVCILPLTDETVGILNRETLGKLPRGSYLINVARGAHLVEADLLALVQSGQIAAATLDVFQQEPLPPEHGFWQEPRITITPHIAAVTLRGDSVRQIAAKIKRLQQGLTVEGVVDRARGY